jgi:hypothetical protein
MKLKKKKEKKKQGKKLTSEIKTKKKTKRRKEGRKEGERTLEDQKETSERKCLVYFEFINEICISLGAASFAAARKENKPIAIEKIDTIAKTLGARIVCSKAVELAQTHPTHNVLVSDRDTVQAILYLLDNHRILVEPGMQGIIFFFEPFKRDEFNDH